LKGYNYYLSLQKDTDKNLWHNYGHIYQTLLAQHEQKTVNFLEIGIYSGGSTKSFESFFSPDSRIVAVDIDISKIRHKFGSNVSIIQADAFTKEFVDKLIQDHGQFDIILDDSLHTYESHDFLLTNHYELLKQNGLMLIEDITYPEINLKELCKKHKCFYIDNRYHLPYNRESNQRDYDASFIIVKHKQEYTNENSSDV
jgi:SAM-dependent methyltransferase